MTARRTRKIDNEIDRNLKQAFDELAGEPLPERFVDLLSRLRADGTGAQDTSPDTSDDDTR